MAFDLDLIRQGIIAKEEDKLDDFLSKYPHLKDVLVPKVEEESPTTSTPESDSGMKESPKGAYKHYLSHLRKKFRGNDIEKKIQNIHDSIEETSLRMMERRPKRKRSGYGLVIGRIQSGKTAHMFGLAMMAIDPDQNQNDPPFDTVIVLSGLTNDLRLQTRDRISEAMEGFSPSLDILPPREVDLKEQDDELTKDRITSHLEGPKSPMLIVIKKNHRVVEHLLESIRSSNHGVADRRVLIIDDEADHASIDTGDAGNGGDSGIDNPSRTNRILRQIIKEFSKSSICWYVGYTATPFANLLIEKGMSDPPNQFGPSLHPRDMLHALPKPQGHLDNEQYFLGPNSHVLVREQVIDLSDEERREIKGVVLRHIITSFIKRSRGIDGHHTTLIHTSTGRPDHKRIAELVRKIVHDIQDEGRSHWTEKELERITWDYSHSLTDHERQVLREFIKISQGKDKFDRFTDLIASIIVAEVNSRPREEGEESPQDLDYSSKDGLSRSYIAIGGTRLARGLTLEGLTTSWFTRRAVSPRYDTMLQMARWCGYRTYVGKDEAEISYADLVRILTTEDIRRDFLTIGNEEVNIRNRIENLPRDADPEQEIIWIRQHPGLHITAPEKMQDVQWRSWGGVMKSVVWSYHSPILGDDALQIAPKLFTETKNLIETAHIMSGSDRTTEGGFELFGNIHPEAVSNFLRFYRDSLEKCTTRDDISQVIENLTGKSEPWDVAVHMPSNKTQKQEILDLSIGLVNRSRDKTEEGRFKIIQNNHQDTLVGKSGADRMRPLLLLYLVDPAATQDSKGVQRVFTKGLKVPVPIFGICLPPPDPSQGGVEAAARE